MTDLKKKKKRIEVNWILRYLTDTHVPSVPFLIIYELVQKIGLWGW